jgi:hypothetical protein
MNDTLKTVLLTTITLSVFTIAMIEISGVSRTALFNKYKGKEYATSGNNSIEEQVIIDKKVQTMPKTTFEFKETKLDFGTMIDGEKKSGVYEIRNTGANPLLISGITVSCGCTAPSYPKEPIMPGQAGSIILEFNSAGKGGDTVNKNALVKCNSAEAPYSIGFTAIVNKKK